MEESSADSLRSPLRDFTNQLATPSSASGSKTDKKTGLVSSPQTGHQERSTNKENRELETSDGDKGDSCTEEAVNRRGPDWDVESDGTVECESAGESSPRPLSLSALADSLARVHLSTPTPASGPAPRLTSFPFSPISDEDASLSGEEGPKSPVARKDLSLLLQESSLTGDDSEAPPIEVEERIIQAVTSGTAEDERTDAKRSSFVTALGLLDKNSPEVTAHDEDVRLEKTISNQLNLSVDLDGSKLSSLDLSSNSLEEYQSCSSDNTLPFESSFVAEGSSTIIDSFNCVNSLSSANEREANPDGDSKQNIVEDLPKSNENKLPETSSELLITQPSSETTSSVALCSNNSASISSSGSLKSASTGGVVSDEEFYKSNAEKSMTPSIVDEDVSPRIVEESITPRIVNESVTPCIVSEGVSPRCIEETISPSIVNESVTPSDVELNITSSIVNESVTPSILEENISPSVIEESIRPSIDEESVSSCSIVCEAESSEKIFLELCETSLSELHISDSASESSSVVVECNIVSEDGISANVHTCENLKSASTEEIVSNEELKSNAGDNSPRMNCVVESNENVGLTQLHITHPAFETSSFVVECSSNVVSDSGVRAKISTSESVKNASIDEIVPRKELKKSEEENSFKIHSFIPPAFHSTCATLESSFPVECSSNISTSDSLNTADEVVTDKELKESNIEENITRSVMGSSEDTNLTEKRESLLMERHIPHPLSETSLVECSSNVVSDSNISLNILNKSLKSASIDEVPDKELEKNIEENLPPTESSKLCDKCDTSLYEGLASESFSSLIGDIAEQPIVTSSACIEVKPLDLLSPHHKRRQSWSLVEGDTEGSPNKRVALDREVPALEKTEHYNTTVVCTAETDIQAPVINSNLCKNSLENSQSEIIPAFVEEVSTEDNVNSLTPEKLAMEVAQQEIDDRNFDFKAAEEIQSLRFGLFDKSFPNATESKETIESVSAEVIESQLKELKSEDLIEEPLEVQEKVIKSSNESLNGIYCCTSFDKSTSPLKSQDTIKENENRLEDNCSNSGKHNNSTSELTIVEVNENKIGTHLNDIVQLKPSTECNEVDVGKVEKCSDTVEKLHNILKDLSFDNVEKTLANTYDTFDNLTTPLERVESAEHCKEVYEEVHICSQIVEENLADKEPSGKFSLGVEVCFGNFSNDGTIKEDRNGTEVVSAKSTEIETNSPMNVSGQMNSIELPVKVGNQIPVGEVNGSTENGEKQKVEICPLTIQQSTGITEVNDGSTENGEKQKVDICPLTIQQSAGITEVNDGSAENGEKQKVEICPLTIQQSTGITEVNDGSTENGEKQKVDILCPLTIQQSTGITEVNDGSTENGEKQKVEICPLTIQQSTGITEVNDGSTENGEKQKVEICPLTIQQSTGITEVNDGSTENGEKQKVDICPLTIQQSTGITEVNDGSAENGEKQKVDILCPLTIQQSTGITEVNDGSAENGEKQKVDILCPLTIQQSTGITEVNDGSTENGEKQKVEILCPLTIQQSAGITQVNNVKNLSVDEFHVEESRSNEDRNAMEKISAIEDVIQKTELIDSEVMSDDVVSVGKEEVGSVDEQLPNHILEQIKTFLFNNELQQFGSSSSLLENNIITSTTQVVPEYILNLVKSVLSSKETVVETSQGNTSSCLQEGNSLVKEVIVEAAPIPVVDFSNEDFGSKAPEKLSEVKPDHTENIKEDNEKMCTPTEFNSSASEHFEIEVSGNLCEKLNMLVVSDKLKAAVNVPCESADAKVLNVSNGPEKKACKNVLNKLEAIRESDVESGSSPEKEEMRSVEVQGTPSSLEEKITPGAASSVLIRNTSVMSASNTSEIDSKCLDNLASLELNTTRVNLTEDSLFISKSDNISFGSSPKNPFLSSPVDPFSPVPFGKGQESKTKKSSLSLSSRSGNNSPLMNVSDKSNTSKPSEMDSLQNSINKLDDLSKLNDQRKSYEDLLDRCSEQERLLGFDDSLKEEADKLIRELANVPTEGDIEGIATAALPSSAYQGDAFLNRSEAGPVTADQDFNRQDCVFQDASTFDFDFLSRVGSKTISRNLERESLFIKFDPLVGKLTPKSNKMRQPDSDNGSGRGIARTGCPAGEEKLVCLSPASDTASSPTITPPRSSTSKSRPSSGTTPTLRHEILSKEISKLQDLMLQQESSYQEQILARTEEVEELRALVAQLETKKEQEGDVEDREVLEERVRRLERELAECVEARRQLAMVVQEYEKTCLQIIASREEDKRRHEVEKAQIGKERDEAIQHLTNMEIAFNDVHQKYEKCKEVIEAFKQNEEEYKRCTSLNNETIRKQEENFRKLKQHATQKLEQANTEINEMRKAHEGDLAKMKAMQRKMEVSCKSLEESLQQKTREAEELSKICDELIKKVECTKWNGR